MRHILIGPLLLLSFALSLVAQTTEMPSSLEIDASTALEAERLGAKVFKLIPVNESSERTQPEDVIRKSHDWASFSYSRESHGVRKAAQVRLQAGLLASYADLNLWANLGSYDLRLIDRTTSEVASIISYSPPRYLNEFWNERKSPTDRAVPIGRTFVGRLDMRYTVGYSYVIRSLALDDSDITVAIHILREEKDGILTIAWKKLAVFPTPIALYMSDEELQEKVNAIAAEGHINCDPVVVKNNHLYYIVQPGVRERSAANRQLEAALNRKGIRYRGAGGQLPL